MQKNFSQKILQKNFTPLKKCKKFLHPRENAKKFAPLKKCKKIFWTPEKMQKILHPWKYAKTYTTTQTPTNSIQNPTKIKGRKIPELPPYEPEKAFEFSLNFPWNSLTKSTLFKDSPSTILIKSSTKTKDRKSWEKITSGPTPSPPGIFLPFFRQTVAE